MSLGRSTFGTDSRSYSQDRPQYPPELFAWISSMCRGHKTAWDCATGNGQAAIGLSHWFEKVDATDLASEQLAEAFSLPNVRYSAQSAEQTSFPDANFDLIAVAQALHWFDFRRFWPEVRRIARQDAFFCAWGYSWFKRTPDLTELHAIYLDPLLDLLKPYWARENGILWNGYSTSDIEFPFDRFDAPPIDISISWDINTLFRYVRTWSAFKMALKAEGVGAALQSLEGDARARFEDYGQFRLSLPLAIAAAKTD